MSDKKQTAVDWLVSQLNKPGFAEVITEEEIQQAKAMEKQQIIDAHCRCEFDGLEYDLVFEVGEEYYNETFNTNNTSKNIVGKQFDLDLGSSPVSVIVKEVTDDKVIVEYLHLPIKRTEEFTISEFEYFATIKL